MIAEAFVCDCSNPGLRHASGAGGSNPCFSGVIHVFIIAPPDRFANPPFAFPYADFIFSGMLKNRKRSCVSSPDASCYANSFSPQRSEIHDRFPQPRPLRSATASMTGQKRRHSRFAQLPLQKRRDGRNSAEKNAPAEAAGDLRQRRVSRHRQHDPARRKKRARGEMTGGPTKSAFIRAFGLTFRHSADTIYC